ncbi:PGPGW domain-containing protein [Paraglaciecola sp.]|uniref:PGPGW domain-containing protein n=1 Tax=Pseudomonadati TaxID=3379134 RepID=UPI00273DE80A|nr:PGPGW domain-containing protein [Paraglaciecola sp.]MDP5031748.1 tellurium resistance protein TerC [Paraglaciecola sp.]
MKKHIRITVGSVFAAFGIIFFILPGSMFVLLLGLMMLSYDVPKAREWLRWCQNAMSQSARKLDAYLLKRKFKN